MDDRTDDALDLQTPDELRPAKRVRIEGSLAVTQETQQEIMEEDDWDDVYGSEENNTASRPIDVGQSNILGDKDTVQQPVSANDGAATVVPYAPPENQLDVMDEQPQGVMEGVTEAAIAQKNDLVGPPSQIMLGTDDQASKDVMDETTEIDHKPSTAPVVSNDDQEFVIAAAAQKDNEQAEWQLDSSDADSSSDSDTSSDSSDQTDSGSDNGYELLDPATAAKILMSGDGDDDDGDKGKPKNAGDRQPRTQNEVKEEVVPKPDVEVTPDTKITFLGTVDQVVENMLLVKGATPGEYQVLEGGSVLCDENRQVIGAVADTLGRVQEPLYMVAFTNSQEIVSAGLQFGSRIFYIDEHSTFVFTQPLKNNRGTDASNIHDEEIGEDEMEFSDDEEEAEFKRLRKAAKKAGRGGFTRSDFQSGARPDFRNGARDFGAPSHSSPMSFGDAPAQSYGGGMSYDDEPTEDFYQPLKRPDNLMQLMGGTPLPPRPQQPSFDGGRGRGRGRGRDDRGRGRGGRGGFESRGGRGGRGGNSAYNNTQRPDNARQGNAQTYPDNHNNTTQQSPPRRSHPPSQNTHSGLSSAQQAWQHAPPQQFQPQPYQFNGQTYQYGYPSVPSAGHAQTAPSLPPGYAMPPPTLYNPQQSPQISSGQIPAGAYVNPTFFQGQQQVYNSTNGQGFANSQPPSANRAGLPPPPNIDLSHILSRLGPQQPPS